MSKVFLLTDDVELTFESDDVKLKNSRFETVPLVAHGNGPSKVTSVIYAFMNIWVVFLSNN